MQSARDPGISSLPAGCQRFPQLQCSSPSQQSNGVCKSSPELASVFAKASALPTHELEILHKWLQLEIAERTRRENDPWYFRSSDALLEAALSRPVFSQSEHNSSQQLDQTCASAFSVPTATREWLAQQDPMCMPRSQQYGNKIEPADPAHEAVNDSCRIVTPDPWDDKDWCLQEEARASTGLQKRLPASRICAAMDRATNEPIDAPPVPRPQARSQLPTRLLQAPRPPEPEVILCDSSDEVLDWSEGNDTHKEIQSQSMEARTFIQNSRDSRPGFSTCTPQVVNFRSGTLGSTSSASHMSRSRMEVSNSPVHKHGDSSAPGAHVLLDFSCSTGGLPAEIESHSEQNTLHGQPATFMVQAPHWMGNVLRHVPKSSFSTKTGTESVSSQADAQRPEDIAASESADPSVDGSVKEMNGPSLVFADMSTAIQALMDLRGRWRDGSGSIYKLSTNSDGKSLNVQTKRPNGKVIFTKRHIRLESEADASGFRIVWGHEAAFMLMRHTLDGDGHCCVQWAVPCTTRQPFEWTRITDNCPTEAHSSAGRT